MGIDGVIKFIGSKWFVLGLGVLVAFAIPFTFKTMSANHTMMNIAVFAMACITAGLSFYKFANMAVKQKTQPVQENREW